MLSWESICGNLRQLRIKYLNTFVRSTLAILLGNLLGYGLFRLAGWAAAFAWGAGEAAPAAGPLIGRLMVTAIAFGAPPVIVGALAARLAGRFEPWVGLGSAAWGLTARAWWPGQVPLLPPESWVAPMMLIFLSGLMGGWLGGGRHPKTGAAARLGPHSPTSNGPGPNS